MTLGCKVNQYETQAIESILCGRGHELTVLGTGADVCILNTCAVTAESGRKSRQAIRRMKKLEPNAKIAVFGCFSQLEPAAVAELGVDLIGGTSDRLGFALDATGDGVLSQNATIHRPPVAFEELPPGNSTSRTRALLKIQDGCDNYCSYCIVPYIRGRSRSLPLELVAEYAKQLNEQSYLEIVITGIEISSYGKDLGKQMIDAIRNISAAAPNARLRLGSLDPALLTGEFCSELSVIKNLCNHFHLSLQSGCDETLQRMGRRYTTSQVLKSIEAIRAHFNKDGKNCGITADLITGFPGETEDEFDKTLDFIKKAMFSDMHIFPYSLRPGTKAAAMPGQVDNNTGRERVRKAIEIAQEMEKDFKNSQIGKTVEVLFEQEKKGLSIGHSENYSQVAVREKVKRNSIKKVKITGIKNSVLTGEIV